MDYDVSATANGEEGGFLSPVVAPGSAPQKENALTVTLTVEQVAVALAMDKQSVRKAIERGTLRAGKVPGGRRGAYYVIDAREVDRYRREHRTTRLAARAATT